MEPIPLKESIKSAEKYIIGEGVKSFINKMQKNLDEFERTRSPEFDEFSQLYVNFYQTKACYNLLRKHDVEIGNYIYDLKDVKDRIAKLRKVFKNDYPLTDNQGSNTHFENFYK